MYLNKVSTLLIIMYLKNKTISNQIMQKGNISRYMYIGKIARLNCFMMKGKNKQRFKQQTIITLL